jgi:tRNA G18 (ribose-2'-O)-methylase SpoU
MDKLKAKELRISNPTPEDIEKIKRNEIYIILDNVWDTYNIGAIFRLADAVAAKKIYICGESETPPNSRIQKASVGTWQWTPWEKRNNAFDAIMDIRKEIPEIQIISVELDKKSFPYTEYLYPLPIAIVVGHETEGVSQEALEASDTIVELPQLGINTSLNVMVSLGIVLYEALEKNNIS